MAKVISKSENKKRIFIVEDHPVFRGGLSALINAEDDLHVCGEAGNASQALEDIGRLKPDVVLVDIGLPGRNGLELLKDLRAIQPDAVMLVISMYDEMLYADRVIRAGAYGYIMKQEGPENILKAIKQVVNRQIYLSPKMSSQMLDNLSDRPGKTNRSEIGRLTDRELEILQLIGEGRDSHDIASRLNLSFKTVDAHRAHIKSKLKLKSGTELIVYAARFNESRGVTI